MRCPDNTCNPENKLHLHSLCMFPFKTAHKVKLLTVSYNKLLKLLVNYLLNNKRQGYDIITLIINLHRSASC